jgi:hypothetical protein
LRRRDKEKRKPRKGFRTRRYDKNKIKRKRKQINKKRENNFFS